MEGKLTNNTFMNIEERADAVAGGVAVVEPHVLSMAFSGNPRSVTNLLGENTEECGRSKKILGGRKKYFQWGTRIFWLNNALAGSQNFVGMIPSEEPGLKSADNDPSPTELGERARQFDILRRGLSRREII